MAVPLFSPSSDGDILTRPGCGTDAEEAHAGEVTAQTPLLGLRPFVLASVLSALSQWFWGAGVRAAELL